MVFDESFFGIGRAVDCSLPVGTCPFSSLISSAKDKKRFSLTSVGARVGEGNEDRLRSVMKLLDEH